MRVLDTAPPPTTLPDLSLAEGRQLSKLSVQQATGSLPGASVFQAVRDSQREGMAILPALRAGDYKEAAAAFIRSTTAALGAIPEVHNLAGFAGIVSAYHGSPHLFDEFKLEKIGTGEGAQAYGHGLYFAENEAVAEGYRKTLAAPNKGAAGIASYHVADAGGDKQAAKAALQHQIDMMEKGLGVRGPDAPKILADSREALGLIDKVGAEPGALYHVKLDVNHEDLLDWDKPLSEQSTGVREKLAGLGVEIRQPAAPDKIAKLQSKVDELQGYVDRAANPGSLEGQLGRAQTALQKAKGSSGRDLYHQIANRGGEYRDAAASAALHQAGIPGIRYLDAGSRKTGDGTRNVVMFDPSLVRIEAVNGQPVTSPADKAAAALSVLAHPEAWGAK